MDIYSGEHFSDTRHEFQSRDPRKCTSHFSVNQLRDPQSFVDIWSEYVENTHLQYVSQSRAWMRHVLSVHKHMIFECSKKSSFYLSRQEIERYCNGFSAEYLMMQYLKQFLDEHDEAGRCASPEWEDGEESIDCSNEYLLTPEFPHNVALEYKHDSYIRRLAEYDAIVLVDDDCLHFLDSTTSAAALHEKLSKELPCEQTFHLFRNKMTQLFHESNGEGGFSTISKIHVLCTTSHNLHSNRRAIDDAVLVTSLPIYHEVIASAERTEYALQESGAIKKGLSRWQVAPIPDDSL